MRRRPDVTLTQLRYFVKAATHSSMTKAADELHIAQSAVSAAISQLEAQIGTQLFIRHRARGLALTAAGEEMLRDTRALLAHLDEVLDGASGHVDQVRGTVRLACFLTLAPFVLPRLLSDLGQAYPELEVDVVEIAAGSGHTCARLTTGRVQCWGANDDGQLGDGTTEVREAPVAVLRMEGYVGASPRLAGLTWGAEISNFLGFSTDTGTTGDLSTDSNTSSSGKGSTERSERLNLLVAAVVTGVLENGNLLISGSQEVRVNHELRILNVAGIVRPQDVNAENEISYDRIAEARISYGGRGRLTEVQQPPIGQQVVDIYSPF